MSNLANQAKKLRINPDDAETPSTDKVRLYKSTLETIEEWLDTGDTRKLTLDALEILIKDVLDVIKGIRGISLGDLGSEASVSAILENLRKARTELNDASTVLEKRGTTHAFFERLTKCQEYLSTALRYFGS